jgi:hypothetical protein
MQEVLREPSSTDLKNWATTEKLDSKETRDHTQYYRMPVLCLSMASNSSMRHTLNDNRQVHLFVLPTACTTACGKGYADVCRVCEQECLYMVMRVIAGSALASRSFPACPRRDEHRGLLGQHIFGRAIIHAFASCNGQVPTCAPLTGVELLCDTVKLIARKMRASRQADVLERKTNIALTHTVAFSKMLHTQSVLMFPPPLHQENQYWY